MSSNNLNSIQFCQEFGFHDELRSHFDFSFTEYVENSIKCEPSHQDLFMYPPFIIAILNSDIERAAEGSPFYAERLDL